MMAMSEFIINANNIYIELEDSIDSFEKEARIIDEAKCYLIIYGDLDDFEYDGGYAVSESFGYSIYYDDLVIKVEIEDGMISDYYFN